MRDYCKTRCTSTRRQSSTRVPVASKNSTREAPRSPPPSISQAKVTPQDLDNTRPRRLELHTTLAPCPPPAPCPARNKKQRKSQEGVTHQITSHQFRPDQVHWHLASKRLLSFPINPHRSPSCSWHAPPPPPAEHENELTSLLPASPPPQQTEKKGLQVTTSETSRPNPPHVPGEYLRARTALFSRRTIAHELFGFLMPARWHAAYYISCEYQVSVMLLRGRRGSGRVGGPAAVKVKRRQKRRGRQGGGGGRQKRTPKRKQVKKCNTLLWPVTTILRLSRAPLTWCDPSFAKRHFADKIGTNCSRIIIARPAIKAFLLLF